MIPCRFIQSEHIDYVCYVEQSVLCALKSMPLCQLCGQLTQRTTWNLEVEDKVAREYL